MAKITLTAVAICLLVSCSTVAVLKKDTPRHNGEFPGNYSALARCVTNKMEDDERHSIRILHYNVRSYPDIETVEVTGTQITTTITAVHFLLKISQKDSESVVVDISGMAETTSNVAWEYLAMCVEEGPDSQK